MKRSLHNLKGYTIEAIDGPKGKVKDFLFDEETWIVRYTEADFGNLWKERRVLIPKTFIKDPEWTNKHFPVNLSREDIESCPDIDQKTPVSREYEIEMSKYYQLEYYWPTPGYTSYAGADLYYPVRPINPPAKLAGEDEMESKLRSFNEIMGYRIRATDGKMGQVHDILVDDEDWQIIYVIIDTSSWKPWSKKVILSIEWMDTISYRNSELNVNLNSEQIKNAPEFDPKHPLDLDYEKALAKYYDQIFEERKKS